MARKSNDSGGGARAWILTMVALVSCFLVYTCLTLRSSNGNTRTVVAESRIVLSAGGAGGEEGKCCRGVENMELWGSAMKWGTDHKFNSSRDCCMACKAMCQVADGPCLCNSWVFCGDREWCGERFGEISNRDCFKTWAKLV